MRRMWVLKDHSLGASRNLSKPSSDLIRFGTPYKRQVDFERERERESEREREGGRERGRELLSGGSMLFNDSMLK